MNDSVKKILGIVLIAFVLVLSFTLIKRLPPIMKVLVIGGDVLAIYYAYTELINKKTKKDEENLED